MTSVTGVSGRPREIIECIHGCGTPSMNATCDKCRDPTKVKLCLRCHGKGHNGGFLCGDCNAEGYK